MVFVGSSSWNVAHHNTFINNSKVNQYTIDGERTGTITSQGYDEGNYNTWYDEEGEYGNIWSDYTGGSSYSIDGRANAEDIYPQKLSNNGSEKANLSISFVVILSIFLGLVCKSGRKSNRK